MLLLICLGLLFYGIMRPESFFVFLFCKDTPFQMFPAQYYSQTENMGAKKKKRINSMNKMRERKNNTVGGHGGIVQVRREGEKGTEIRVAWQKWSLYSKCSSVTKVSDPALCGAFHFPGARNRARAERVCVCLRICV